MDRLQERAHGAALAFILAQFIPSWISIPVCVLLLILYGTSPLLHAQRLRDALLQRVMSIALKWPSRTAAVPDVVVQPTMDSIPTDDFFK
jgi:hypothetical protein